MKALYIDASSGASGDMFLGALVDAGADRSAILDALGALNLDGWSVTWEETSRAGLRALHARVETAESTTHRHLTDILEIINTAGLSEGVRRGAADIFTRLGAAEAAVHGVDINEVHFHEVGALDAIVDIVGTAAALHDLGPKMILCSPVTTGTGTTRSAHGELSVPPPAVAELIRNIPARFVGEGELLTPTGAAIIATMCNGFMPTLPMATSAIGYGAGTRDIEGWPNVLRVMVGEIVELDAMADHLVLEANLDDMSPELIPYAIERLLAAGAHDAWTTPIVMKKGRPAVTLSVLCVPDNMHRLLDVIYSETTTLGVRLRHTGKHELDREWATVKVEGYDIRIKIARFEGRISNIKPEHEDAAKVARITGLPLKEVIQRALGEFHP